MGPVLYLYGAFLLFGFNVVSTCPDGDCRELAFPEFFFFANKRLVNHSIETLQVNDFDMCQMRCYQNPNCVSINFNFNEHSQENHNCELNNATHKSHENELDAKTGYAYHGTLNACDKVYCANGGTCQSGFTDKGYRCLCRLGFTSARCEEDIDECSTGKHNCSQVAVCNNTIGSYNCTCKEGYVGDGRNCSDIDECSRGEYNCSHVAVCNNTIGSYNCTCREGYVGDGRNCSDIDECSSGKHYCSNVAVCNNTIGSYNCTCKKGYVGDGRNCSGCPKDWKANGKYCYKRLADQPKTLKDARKRCREMFADLPIIKSEQENTFIAGLMMLTPRVDWVWLGIERKEGELRWFDGISAERTNGKRYNAWANSHPSSSGHCAYIKFLGTSNVLKWYADLCKYNFGGAPFLVCQKSPL